MTTPKRNEAVAWRYWSAFHAPLSDVLGPGEYEYVDVGKWHPDRAEPLYSKETVAALYGEVSRLREVLSDLFGADMEELMMRDGKDDQIEAIAKAKKALNLEPPTDGR